MRHTVYGRGVGLRVFGIRGYVSCHSHSLGRNHVPNAYAYAMPLDWRDHWHTKPVCEQDAVCVRLHTKCPLTGGITSTRGVPRVSLTHPIRTRSGRNTT